MLDLKWTTTPDKFTRPPACEVIGRGAGRRSRRSRGWIGESNRAFDAIVAGPERGRSHERGNLSRARIVPVRVPPLAALEKFLHQLFALLGVAGREKPPTNGLNLYWNLKYIDVRSFILTGAPIKSTISEQY